MQTHVAEKQRSRLSSLEQFGSLALVPFGFLLGAGMQETIGAAQGMIGGAAFLVAASLLVLALPSVRRIRSAGSRSLAELRATEEGTPRLPITSPLEAEGDAA